jgi:TolB protein
MTGSGWQQILLVRIAVCGGLVLSSLAVLVGQTGGSPKPAGPKQITHVMQDVPSYSPDGKSIVYVNDDDGPPANIYVMDADGRHPRRLTKHPQNDDGPIWSPDGSMIAFETELREGLAELFVMSADGSNLRQVTHDGALALHPSWSRDGTHLMYTSTRDSKDKKNPEVWETYTIKLDGTDQKRITSDDGINTYASYSPDGSKILFRKKIDGGKNSEVFVMNADGTNMVNLTRHPAYDRFPCWSPDGKKVVFESNRDGHSQLYVIAADGTNLRLLVDGPGNLSAPRFSPDGRKVIYPREFEGEVKVFTVDVQ